MEKIKHFCESEKGKDILIVLIVILVGSGSFELGRLSKNNSKAGIKIEYLNQESNVISSITDVGRPDSRRPTSNTKTFFASSKGSKYYSIGCSAGKTLKQENRIYFATREEAETAGYELASSCQ